MLKKKSVFFMAPWEGKHTFSYYSAIKIKVRVTYLFHFPLLQGLLGGEENKIGISKAQIIQQMAGPGVKSTQKVTNILFSQNWSPAMLRTMLHNHTQKQQMGWAGVCGAMTDWTKWQDFVLFIPQIFGDQCAFAGKRSWGRGTCEQNLKSAIYKD